MACVVKFRRLCVTLTPLVCLKKGPMSVCWEANIEPGSGFTEMIKSRFQPDIMSHFHMHFGNDLH